MSNSDQFIFLPEYGEIIKAIKENPVVYVSGAAGTGKSTFIKYIRSKVKSSMLLAPTGIAALNIKGKTIHSAFKLPPTFITPADIKMQNLTTRQYIKSCNLIIIDEISMVSSNLLDAVDEFLQLNTNSKRPFGGIHILLVGDLFQLPPIIGDKVKSIYNEYYQSPMFFDSYSIQNLIKENKFKAVRLNRVMRQNDLEFINILNNIRTGNNIEDVIDTLNQKVKISNNIPDNYVQITPYNDVSDNTNRKKLDEIKSIPKTYYGIINGNFNQKNFPVPQSITLKVGAQVMVCKNINKDIVNGTVGKVLELNDDSITIQVNSQKVTISKVAWEEYSYNKVGDTYKAVVTGSYYQLPIKLAWSMTIHKVQSATIKNLYIDLDRGAFAPGMLYVALSRAVSLDGLILSANISYDDVIVDQRSIDFYKTF